MMTPLKHIIAALTLCLVGGAAGAETIHSPDIYLRYSLLDASIYASEGGALEVYGAPAGGASAEEVAAAMRLPSYLAQRDVTAVPPGTKGYRLALVFAPKAGLLGETVCEGGAKGGVAGARTKILGVFCRGERTILSEATLEAHGAFAPGQPGFAASMSRFVREIMPRRNPLFQGERGCRRAC